MTNHEFIVTYAPKKRKTAKRYRVKLTYTPMAQTIVWALFWAGGIAFILLASMIAEEAATRVFHVGVEKAVQLLELWRV